MADSTKSEQQETRSQTKKEKLINFITSEIKEFTLYNFKDDNLREPYKEEFDELTKEDFNLASTSTLRCLRTFLRSRGVWVQWDRKFPLATSLYNTLLEADPTAWTKEEVERSNETLDSVKIINILQKNSNTRVSKNPTTLSFSNISSQQAKLENKQQYQSNNYANELVTLTKFYQPDLKCSGENDKFGLKLKIFFELCEKAAIPEPLYQKAFSTMLSGAALRYYYSSLATESRRDFDTLCSLTQNYFEGEETKRKKSARWESLSLQKIINENHDKGKTTEECLQILIEELRDIQLSLDIEYRTDKFLHTKLINACRSIPAFQLACFKPSSTLIGLISDLHSSITTCEENSKSDTQFFTDRRYFKKNTPRSPSRPHLYHQKFKSPPRRIIKTCYVCKQQGCHSKNHSKAEQDEARNTFKNCFMKRFDQRINQYLAEHEDSKDEASSTSTDSEEIFETLVLG